VFLFLLWLWLRTSAEDYTDFPDLSCVVPSPSRGNSANCSDSPAELAEEGGVVSETWGAVAQAEEFAIPLLALIILGTLLLSSLWIIYSAPILFAELLVDGVLSASLYRRLRGLETQHWLETAIRRTIWPVIITTVVVGIGGMLAQSYAPEAKSVGDVIHHYQKVQEKTR